MILVTMKSNKYIISVHNDLIYQEIVKKFGNPAIHIGYESLHTRNTEYFEFLDLLYCRYDDILLNNLPPIDSEILEKLRIYQINFLKICERLYKGNMSFEERLNFFYRHVQFWNYKLEQKGITHFIQYNVPHEGFDYVIYALCKIKKIKTIFSYKLPVIKNILTKRYFINDIDQHKKIYKKKELIRNPEELELSFKNLYYSIYPSKSPNKKQIKFKTYPRIAKQYKLTFLKKILLLINTFYKYGFKNTFNKITNKLLLFHSVKYKNPYLTSDIELNKSYKILVAENIPNKPYVFFALNYQPELSSVPLGNNYSDLNLVLDMLAWVGSKYNFNVLVKKHPRNDTRRYFRPKDIYQRMSLHKNVFLIDEKKEVTSLISESIAVASVAGSSCWEAFLRKKPTLLFGSIIYENAPGAFKINSLNDLLESIQIIVDKKITISDLDIINYLKFLEEHTFDHAQDKNLHAAPKHLTSKVHIQNFVDNLEKEIKEEQNLI